MVFLGNPEYGVDLQPIDFVKFAEACGAVGFRVEDPKECGAVLDRALASNSAGPVVIEAVVDPFEAPMPPKISLEQATKFAESLVRGEPNRKEIVATVIADKVRELV
jgi:pyruvate dehydrogenase (quinone)/pyruvate oxidase